MARTARPRIRRIRALLTPAVDNWLSRAYLALVAASLGFFLWAAYLSEDVGFAGIWPLITTAPGSFLALLLPAPTWAFPAIDWLGPLLFAAGTAASGLVNAALLGVLARQLRPRSLRAAN
ncbi:SCO4225 family membrane protein [Streptomyces boninensis]|uniref:SCO4225 family membrane protein n=1 Tax=Streptomyces boninensis TaxID=2039455 RepID=UPI003B2192AE